VRFRGRNVQDINSPEAVYYAALFTLGALATLGRIWRSREYSDARRRVGAVLFGGFAGVGVAGGYYWISPNGSDIAGFVLAIFVGLGGPWAEAIIRAAVVSLIKKRLTGLDLKFDDSSLNLDGKQSNETKDQLHQKDQSPS